MFRVNLYLVTMIGCLVSTNLLADSCETLLNKLRKDPHLTLVMHDEMQYHFQYGNDIPISLSINCMQPEPDAGVNWDGFEPNAQYYDLIGRVGTLITGRDADDVIQTAKKCYNLALKDSSELASIDGRKMMIDCQVSKQDGGSTSINIYPQ